MAQDLTRAGGDTDWPAFFDHLERLPQEPVSRTHPRNWAFRLKRAADFIGHARPQHARFWRKMNPYPRQWRHLTFRAEDGVQIAAWMGLPEGTEKPAFGLVIVPGMFSTKDDTAHKRRAIRIWRYWHIPVMVIDMRAFGESTGIATAGWKEALDVHAAVRQLAEASGVDRIAVMAESMAGAAALNALAQDSRSGTDLMKGGVLTWSAFVDAKDAVVHIDQKPTRDHPYRMAYESFQRLMLYRSMGGYRSFAAYLEDAAHVNGLESMDELLDLANPKWKISMMHHPVLCVHSTNDPVVPVRHARRMDRYTREHPHIGVLITNWGEHTGFEAMDPWWFWEVARQFYGTVNGVELPNLARESDRAAGEA